MAYSVVVYSLYFSIHPFYVKISNCVDPSDAAFSMASQSLSGWLNPNRSLERVLSFISNDRH